MSYAQKNLRDVKDSAPDHGLGEVGEARFPREDIGAERTGLAYHVLRPGRRQAFGHRHEEAEEIYVVLSGEGLMKLDEEIIEVGPMDAIRVAPHVTRAFEAGADAPLEVLAFGPRYPGDGEIVRDFWGE